MRWTETRGIRGAPIRYDSDYIELLLEELRREDDLFTGRFNLFLIAESLLFLSAATLMIAQNINYKAIAIIELLSILITSIYIVIINRARIYIGELHVRLQGLYPNYRLLRDSRIGKGNVNSCHVIMSILFLFAWIGLLIFNL